VAVPCYDVSVLPPIQVPVSCFDIIMRLANCNPWIRVSQYWITVSQVSGLQLAKS
jgi:hypothetical protein